MPHARCGDYGGKSVVRDAERNAILDANGEVMSKPCRGFVVKGSDPPRCLMHLSGPDARRKRAAREKAYVTRHWGELNDLISGADLPELDPMNALLEVVRWTGAMMRVMQILTGELPIEPGMGIVETEDGEKLRAVTSGIYGHDHMGEQAPHVFMNLLGIWTDRHMKACKMALDAGVDERLVRNAESTSERLFSAFTIALQSVALTDEVRQSLQLAFSTEVRRAIDVTSSPTVTAASQEAEAEPVPQRYVPRTLTHEDRLRDFMSRTPPTDDEEDEDL